MHSDMSNKSLQALVSEFKKLIAGAPKLFGQDYMIGSPSYGVMLYQLDQFDINIRFSRLETVARNYRMPVDLSDVGFRLNGRPIMGSICEISGEDFLIEEEEVVEINYGTSARPEWVWYGDANIKKLEWGGNLDNFVGALSYLRMMASLVENS